MAGNEIAIVQYLVSNIGTVKLPHLGLVKTIGAPDDSSNKFTEIKSLEDLQTVSTEDAKKKADIYINGVGVSIKQSGSSFSFNRIQRSEILKVFNIIDCESPENCLIKIDKAVDDFHKGIVAKRSRPWNELFTENDFKNLVRYLMMQGSPNNGDSKHPAELILVAPKIGVAENNISVYTFDEYFEYFKANLFIAIRRQWVGQISKSEHGRALGIASKPGNDPWVYNDIAGSPRKYKPSGKVWREEIPENERKTVYILFVEKK
jgi:hypothetical protein